MLPALRAEEANLLHAAALARTHQLPADALACLQGLRQLYGLTGRDVEWARLVADIDGDYLDPATDHPLPGRDEQYSIVMSYRVQIAQARRDWSTATRLQTAAHQLEPATGPHPTSSWPPTSSTPPAVTTCAASPISEHDLGRILLEQGDPACLSHYRAAYKLAERIGDTAGQAIQASNLGNAYLDVPGLRDLDQAQHWHQRELDLTPETRPARPRRRPRLPRQRRLRAVPATPATPAPPTPSCSPTSTTARDRAPAGPRPAARRPPRPTAPPPHNQLGNLYSEVGDVRQALHHYQQSIHHKEARGDTYGAGQTRYNIALLLARAGRPGDALHYARAALDNFRAVGPGAADRIARAEQLIQLLEAYGRPTGTT